jgi:hypothetical protein
MFDTKTPSTLEIIEDARLKTRLIELGRRQQETAEGLKDQRLTDEQVKNEQFQAISNALAEQLPLYSAARAASNNFLVVPLDGTKPLADPREATNDPRVLFEWWSKDGWGDCNPGVLLGRVGGIFALQVNDIDAYQRLREMAKVRHEGLDDGRDSVKGYTEYRELGGYSVHLVKTSRPVSMRLVQGWGKDYTNALRKVDREDRQRQIETFFLVYSFHSVVSGLDAWDFKSRTILPGVRLLGEGEVLPWNGSIIKGHPEGDDVKVVAPTAKPPEVPPWLAQAIGRPRSRKAIAAAREAYEALQRRDNAHVIARIAATRAFEDEARAKAEEDRARAERVLADEMARG